MVSESMKFLIKSPKYVKRNRWFINEEYGISLDFYWLDCSCQVLIDTQYLEEGCQEEWTDLVGPFIGKEFDADDDSAELSVDYPGPWFITDPSKACLWKTPEIPSKLSDGFKLVLRTNYIYEKAAQFEKLKKRNGWSTQDNDFKWKVENQIPYAHQKSSELKILADILISNEWVSDGRLEEYLANKFGLSIDEDSYTFYSPAIEPGPA